VRDSHRTPVLSQEFIMAAKAIVAERQSVAIDRIREQVAAISKLLGIEPVDLEEHVKGDADYQEMVRTEQLAELLSAVRAKVETPKVTDWSQPSVEVSTAPVDPFQPEPDAERAVGADHGRKSRKHQK
jgi:hypothetical protein